MKEELIKLRLSTKMNRKEFADYIGNFAGLGIGQSENAGICPAPDELLYLFRKYVRQRF